MEPPCAKNLGHHGHITPYLFQRFKIFDQQLTQETYENDSVLIGLSPLGSKRRGG